MGEEKGLAEAKKGLATEAKKTFTKEVLISHARKIIGTPKESKAPEKEQSVLTLDPYNKKKWDLKAIKAEKAWLEYSKGSKDIVVAVIDTGADVKHPDLKANIWKNPKEIPGNKKDDDQNGYVDDVHGWDFANNSPRVTDTHGHGSHIAGIIGAVGENGEGISGVAPKVSLMILKYYNPNDNGANNLKNTIKAIHYAVKNGAHIINYSGGGLEGNDEEKKAIKLAAKKGILFVAAAGNEGSDMDKQGYYPAKYALNNILPVMNTDDSDQVPSSSNYGKKSVHNAAPGSEILSTLPGGNYGYMTGTSQATAVATGAAVLIMDYYKNKTARFVIQHLRMTGDIKSSLQAKTSFGRRLNIFKALQARGMSLNALDQKVHNPFIDDLQKDNPDSVDSPFLTNTKDISRPTGEPLSSADEELLSGMELPFVRNKKNQRETAGEKNSGRGPASVEKKKTPFLKRWFF